MRDVPVKSTMGLWGLLRRHALLAALVAVYGTVALSLGKNHPILNTAGKGDVFVNVFLIQVPQILFMVLLWRLLQLTYVTRDPDRVGTLRREVVGFLADRDRVIGGLIAMVLMASVLMFFSQVKHLITIFNPFGWDEYFMRLDRLLHFGQHPYIFAHAVFGGHYTISFFTGIYNLWLTFTYAALLIACFLRPDSLVRMQYLVAFILTWSIGGNLLATVFSSAGPVYYADLGLGDTYGELMGWLRAHAATGALTVVETQSILWRLHTADVSLNAISAFPSMHVASSVLTAIFAFRHSRALGYAAAFFALCIQIGSVLLAWHYAVDGYAGAVIAVCCWLLAGWLVRSIYARQASTLARA